MVLSKIRDRVRQNKYKNRQQFLDDMQLMKSNCYTYNETRNPHLLKMVDNLFNTCQDSLRSYDKQLTELETEIAEEINNKNQVDDDFESESFFDSVDNFEETQQNAHQENTRSEDKSEVRSVN